MENKGKLLLFDIDGTLVMPHRDNTLHNRFTEAFNRTFGTKLKADIMNYNGKTAKLIFIEMGNSTGIKRSMVLRNMDKLLMNEKTFIKQNIGPKQYIAINGVLILLKELRKRGYRIGLVTGNSQYSSIFKLKHTNLDGFFKFGEFGDLSERREKLIISAIKKANKKFKTRFSKKNVFYFGDAPLDIEAGRKAAVNVIALCTGWCTKQELDKYHPDYLLKDLSDMPKVLKILGS